jgi:hypothetical protein
MYRHHASAGNTGRPSCRRNPPNALSTSVGALTALHAVDEDANLIERRTAMSGTPDEPKVVSRHANDAGPCPLADPGCNPSCMLRRSGRSVGPEQLLPRPAAFLWRIHVRAAAGARSPIRLPRLRLVLLGRKVRRCYSRLSSAPRMIAGRGSAATAHSRLVLTTGNHRVGDEAGGRTVLRSIDAARGSSLQRTPARARPRIDRHQCQRRLRW